ncbi:MAG: hypothetical protein WB424_02905 [Terracidiphilus sp.]
MTTVNPTMKLREEPPLMRFKVGDVLQGVLISFARARLADGFGIKYLVQKDDGSRVSFWGTTQINSFLHLPSDRGHYVQIKCMGEDASVRRGENCMKVFEVLVSDEVIGEGEDSTFITDADIPF